VNFAQAARETGANVIHNLGDTDDHDQDDAGGGDRDRSKRDGRRFKITCASGRSC
jgi:hypothetical protein